MSDIQEQIKLAHKRAEENDLKATMKPLFPEGVEMVCISKDDYDRLCGDLTYENIELKDRINKAVELLLDKYVRGLLNDNEVNNIVKILKGDNK